MGEDIIDRSITGERSLVGHARAGVVFSEVLQDVVFDERALGPAIQGKIGISGGLEVSSKVDVAN